MAKILVVDDEPINIKMLSRLLIQEHYEVLGAANGEQALEVTEREQPDLILLDVMMPGMDGFEVCRRLKSQDRTRNIPIVMVTALDTLEDKVKGIDAGADDFLPKPYNKLELLARSRSLIKMKSLNDQLNQAYNQITQIVSYSDRIMRAFDPGRFALHQSMLEVMNQLLARGEAEPGKPKVIFLAIGPFSGDRITGRVYRRSPEGEVVPDHRKVTLSPEDVVGIGDQGVDVAFNNWQDVSQSLEEYQEYLPEDIVAVIGRVVNSTAYMSGKVAVVCYNYGHGVGAYDAQVVKAIAAHSNFLTTVADQVLSVEKAYQYTVEALARAAEANDGETGNHIRRVNSYAAHLAREIGQPDDFVRDIGDYAMMHDVGKIHVERHILQKPGPLTDQEWEEMKRHTIYGAKILGNHPRLLMARQIAIHHHERWDGGGYPQGLSGEKISLSGRITMLADVYDALRSPRSYKPGFSHEKTRNIIINGDGRTMPGHFDPRLLEVFRQSHDAFAAIWDELADEPEVPPQDPTGWQTI